MITFKQLCKFAVGRLERHFLVNRVEAPANEFKRRQLPPTLIISRHAIGIGRRRPITHRYRRQVLAAVERTGKG